MAGRRGAPPAGRLPLLAAALLASLLLLGGLAWALSDGSLGQDESDGSGSSKEPAQTVEVPDLAGQTVSDAESSLTEVGLHVGDVTEEPSETIPEGQTIEQSISAGDTVESGIELSSPPYEKPDEPDDGRLEAYKHTGSTPESSSGCLKNRTPDPPSRQVWRPLVGL